MTFTIFIFNYILEPCSKQIVCDSTAKLEVLGSIVGPRYSWGDTFLGNATIVNSANCGVRQYFNLNKDSMGWFIRVAFGTASG